jgi:hypothetical protein
MAVTVGINEYVVLSGESKLNEKDTLELHFKTDSGLSEETKINMQLEGKEFSDRGTRILCWGVDSNTWDKSGRKTISQISKELGDYKNQLKDILAVYLTNAILDKEFGKEILTNGKDSKEYIKALEKDAFVIDTCKNIANKFLELCTKYKIFDSTMDNFRIKLHRQKLTKPYPCLPKYGVWIESMRVPVPKVVPVKYDLALFDAVNYPTINRLSAEPIEEDKVTPEQEASAGSLFNNMDETSAASDLPFVDKD